MCIYINKGLCTKGVCIDHDWAGFDNHASLESPIDGGMIDEGRLGKTHKKMKKSLPKSFLDEYNKVRQR